MKNRDIFLFGGLYFVIAVLYLYPYFATFLTIGYQEIPPLFDSDLYLYMNFSNVHISPNNTITSPWYGDTINASTWAYRKFDLSFIVFRIIASLCGHNWTITMIVWTLFWITLIYIAAFYLFREIAGRDKKLLIAFGLLFLFLMRVPEISNIIKTYLHFSISDTLRVDLAFSRAFFPQASIVFLFLYLYLLIKVLKESKISLWITLSLVQFLALKTFPYLLMILAFLTFLVLFFYFFIEREKLKFSHIFIYAFLCIFLDLSYLILTGHTESAGMKTQIIDIDFSRLKYFFKGSMILAIIFASLIAFIKPKSSNESKIVILSLGLSYIILTLSHAFFSPALQIENHIYYFAATIFAIEIFYLLVQLDSYWKLSLDLKRNIGFAAILLMIFQGAVSAHSHYKRYYLENRINYEVFQQLKKIGCDRDTLIITPAFVPSLISPISFSLECKSEILYHPDAHFLSKKKKGEDTHKIRQAIYLYLKGADEAWIDKLWDKDTDWRVQYEYVIPALRLFLKDENRKSFLAKKREEMRFYFEKFVKDNNKLSSFFRKYKKIVIVDFKDKPHFSKDRLNTLFRKEEVEDRDNLVFYIMKSK